MAKMKFKMEKFPVKNVGYSRRLYIEFVMYYNIYHVPFYSRPEEPGMYLLPVHGLQVEWCQEMGFIELLSLSDWSPHIGLLPEDNATWHQLPMRQEILSAFTNTHLCVSPPDKTQFPLLLWLPLFFC